MTDIHPLALEDVFHARSQTRSKADYYSKHLFLRVMAHELGDPNEPPEPTNNSPAFGSTLTDLPRTSSPLPFTDEDEESYEMKQNGVLEDDRTLYSGSVPRKGSLMQRKRTNFLKTNNMEKSVSTLSSRLGKIAMLDPEAVERKRLREEEVATTAMKREADSVNVKVYPMFIFLFRDGTVISMHPKTNCDLTQPISRRLQQRDTVLRNSADPSLLVQSLLDLG